MFCLSASFVLFSCLVFDCFLKGLCFACFACLTAKRKEKKETFLTLTKKKSRKKTLGFLNVQKAIVLVKLLTVSRVFLNC